MYSCTIGTGTVGTMIVFSYNRLVLQIIILKFAKPQLMQLLIALGCFY
jgi:hypothetical protein